MLLQENALPDDVVYPQWNKCYRPGYRVDIVAMADEVSRNHTQFEMQCAHRKRKYRRILNAR